TRGSSAHGGGGCIRPGYVLRLGARYFHCRKVLSASFQASEGMPRATSSAMAKRLLCMPSQGILGLRSAAPPSACSRVLDDCASDLLRSRGQRLPRSFCEENTKGAVLCHK